MSITPFFSRSPLLSIILPSYTFYSADVKSVFASHRSRIPFYKLKFTTAIKVWWNADETHRGNNSTTRSPLGRRGRCINSINAFTVISKHISELWFVFNQRIFVLNTDTNAHIVLTSDYLSTLYNLVADTRFVFVITYLDSNGMFTFRSSSLWNWFSCMLQAFFQIIENVSDIIPFWMRSNFQKRIEISSFRLVRSLFSNSKLSCQLVGVVKLI